LAQSLELATSLGLELLDWAGQNTYSMREDGWQGAVLPDDAMRLKRNEPGQFLVFLSRKKSSPRGFFSRVFR